MYTGVKHLHSSMAYLVLIGLLIAIIYTIASIVQNKPFTKQNKTMALVGLIVAHLQLLFGLIIYFVSPLGMSNMNGDTMKNSAARLMALEHPLMMIIGIILITIGYSKSKKATTDNAKLKKIAIFYTIGLIFIISRIPWNVWLGA
jgi:cytochrome bd-type quinol oxidase subunit 2